MEQVSELMSVNRFLESYAIGRTSFYKEVKAGRIKLRKFGTASLVARSDAESWAAALPVMEVDTQLINVSGS